MIVQNIISNSGNPVVNQFIIRHNGKTFFQSYDSPIAVIDSDNHLTLSEDWDYSPTTKKYLYKFLDSNWRGPAANKKVINTLAEEGTINIMGKSEFEIFINTL